MGVRSDAGIIPGVQIEQRKVRNLIYEVATGDPSIHGWHGGEAEDTPGVRLVKFYHVGGGHHCCLVWGQAAGGVQAAPVGVVVTVHNLCLEAIPQMVW